MLPQGEMLNNLTAQRVVKRSHSKNWMPSFLMKNCIMSLSSDKLIKPLWFIQIEDGTDGCHEEAGKIVT